MLSLRDHLSKIKNHLLCVVGTFFIAASTTALTPATLLTPELESRPINLSGLSGGVLSYFDNDRRLMRSPAADYVRLTIEEQPEALEAAGWVNQGLIELVDGQSIVGRWSGTSRDGEAILWTHPTLGQFTLGLDDVRRVVMERPLSKSSRDTANLGTPAGDTVYLRNGDRFVGFIIAVADEAVTIQPDGAEGEITIDRANVAMLQLANPLMPANELGIAGDWVEMVDGSRVRGADGAAGVVEGLSIRRETLRFVPALADAMRPVDVALNSVTRIDFAASGLRLVDLDGQPMTTVAGGSAFGLDLPPTVESRGIRLHAPVTVVFDLPEGARRFISRVVLNLPAGLSERQARLADVRVSARPAAAPAGSESEAVRLRADRPWSMLSHELDGAEQLRIELDPMDHGPILDRVLLEDAMILLELPDPGPSSGDTLP